MNASRSIRLELPRFVFRKALLNLIGPIIPTLTQDLAATPINVSRFLDIDIAQVKFIDDCAVLLFLAIEHKLLHLGYGMRFVGTNVESIPMRRQLSETGALEVLLAHRLLWDQLATQRSDASLFDTGSLTTKALACTVMKLTFCRNLDALDHRSSEQRKIEEFDNIYRRRHFVHSLTRDATHYDLISSGEFRNLILQQTRYNIAEHAAATVGMSIARIFSMSDLQQDWELSSKEMSELIEADNEFSILSGLHGNDAKFLRLGTIDNGKGIPETLKQALTSSDHLPGLTPESPQVKQILAATSDWSAKERLCSFSTYSEGTSKKHRENEPKGLTTLKNQFVFDLQGVLSIHSADSSILFHPRTAECGVPVRNQYGWCDGGTEIIISVPLRKLDAGGSVLTVLPHPFVPARRTSPRVEELDLNAELRVVRANQLVLEPTAIKECTRNIIQKLRLPPRDANNQPQLLTQNKENECKLVVVDWSELFIPKDSLGTILRLLAEELKAAIENNFNLKPFVFANVPSSALGLIPDALSHFPIPICVFYDSNRQWSWLGLERAASKIILIPRLSSKAKENQRLKLNCRRELQGETLCRLVFDEVLQAKGFVRCTDVASFPHELQERVLSLLRRCSLFEEEEALASRDELPMRTNKFKPVVLLDDIGTMILEGFCNKLKEAIRQPPIRIHKPEGIRTSSNWVVENFYRCDYLAQHKIADELGNELVDVALAILQLSHTEVLDFVVSCTSPTHWFVNRLCDGLRNTGYDCGRHVFRRRSSIRNELRNLNIGKGTKVLLFTDVISSGELVGQMSQALEDNGATVVGLIALVEARTKEEMDAYSASNPDPLQRFNAGTAVALTTIENPKRDSKIRKYGSYIDPETLEVKPATRDLQEQWIHFFTEVFGGKGEVIASATFGSPDALLKRLSECGALTYGHFIHGANHSNVLCDARKVFNDELLRNEIVTNLSKYILKHEISVVVSPNHSNVYLLTQALQYRFNLACEEGGGRQLLFATALQVQNRSGEGDYQLTMEVGVEGSASAAHAAVMILDDGVCSGTTIKTLVREVVAAFKNQKLPTPSIHVIAFVSRLSESDASFWDAINHQADGKLNFAYFMALPLPAHVQEHCPICKQQAEVGQILRSSPASDYISLFCRNWIEALNPLDLYTVANSQRSEVLSGEAVRTLAAHFIALRRGNVRLVWQKIMEELNATVVITVLGHLLLRSYDINAREPSPPQVIKQMLRFAKTMERTLGEKLYILRKLIQFAKLSTSPTSLINLIDDIVDAYTPALEDQLILGGLEVLLFQLLFGEAGFKDPHQIIIRSTAEQHAQQSQQVLNSLDAAVQKSNDSVIRLSLTWLIHSLSGKNTELKSIGAAVLRLASHSRLVPHHHSQRFVLQEASGFVQNLINRPEITDQHKRLENLCRGVSLLFSEMYDCIEVLAPHARDLETPYHYLQEQKHRLKHLEEHLSLLRESTDAIQVRAALEGLYDVLERLRTAWFSSSVDRVGKFLRPFSLQPAAVINEITKAYTGKASIETTGLVTPAYTIALFPHEEFATLVRHLYSHLDDPKKIIPGQAVYARWQEMPHALERSKLVLILRNNSVKRHGLPVLRGLGTFKEALRQYGGELDVEIEDSERDSICTIKITLHKWE